MTAQELKNLVTQLLTRVGNDRITDSDIRTVFNAVIDFIVNSDLSELIPLWAPNLEFNTDGNGAGAYAIFTDLHGNNRLWRTKVDNNIGNEPPQFLTETDQWLEVSPSAGSAISLWKAGVFGEGLVIDAHDHSVDGPGLYWLLEPARPFESTDIEAEILTNKWLRLGGSPDVWKLDGNSLSAIKKFGTKTNHDVPFIANDVERGRLFSAGGWELRGYGVGSGSTLLLKDGLGVSRFNFQDNGDMVFLNSGYKIGNISNLMTFDPSSGSGGVLFYSPTGNATEYNSLILYAQGKPNQMSNTSRLIINFTPPSINAYYVGQDASGSGTNYPIILGRFPENDLVMATNGSVGINISHGSIHASAQVHINSTTKGVLFPSLTTTQRDAIGSPANGLFVYNNTKLSFDYFNGSEWLSLLSNSVAEFSKSIDPSTYPNPTNAAAIGAYNDGGVWKLWKKWSDGTWSYI